MSFVTETGKRILPNRTIIDTTAKETETSTSKKKRYLPYDFVGPPAKDQERIEEPKPEIISKEVTLKPNEKVDVTWENESGELTTSNVSARNLRTFETNLQSRNSRIISASVNGDVFYKSPTTKEWQLQVMKYHQYNYEKYGVVPYSLITQVNVPSEISQMGVEPEYRDISYKVSLGIISEDEGNRQLNIIVSKSQTVEYMKQYGSFGTYPQYRSIKKGGISVYGEFPEARHPKAGQPITWKDLKKRYPAIELRKTSEGFQTYMDYNKWQREQNNPLGEVLSTVFNPNAVQYPIESLRGPTWKPSMGFRWENPAMKQVRSQSQYGYTQDWEKGNWFNIASKVVSSPFVSIPISYTIGNVFGYINRGKTSEPLFKIGKFGVQKQHLITGALIGGSAPIVGYQFYESFEKGGMDALRDEVLRFSATAFLNVSAFHYGYKSGSRIRLEQKVSLESDKPLMYGERYYKSLFGKQKTLFEVSGAEYGWNPDITSYQGNIESDIVFTPSRTGMYYPKSFKLGVEPIPKNQAIVPYTPKLPMVAGGLSFATGFITMSNYPFKELTIGMVDLSPKNISWDVKPVDNLISFKGTPRELQKPFGYRSIMGKIKYMPDLITHKGYPIKEIPVEDWMDTSIPREKSLVPISKSADIIPYHAFDIVGFGKLTMTKYITQKGYGYNIKTVITPFPSKILSEQPSKNYVRLMDKTGKQIGHSFIYKDEGIIEMEKSKGKSWYERTSDINIPSSQIKTPGDVWLKNTPSKTFWKTIDRYVKGKSHPLVEEGYKNPFPNVERSLITRPQMSLAKRNLYWLFGSKPVAVIFVGNKEFYRLFAEQPITSFIRRKGTSFTLKDLRNKWDKELGGGIYPGDIISGGEGQQTILKPPETRFKTDVDRQMDKISETSSKKIFTVPEELKKPVYQPPHPIPVQKTGSILELDYYQQYDFVKNKIQTVKPGILTSNAMKQFFNVKLEPIQANKSILELDVITSQIPYQMQNLSSKQMNIQSLDSQFEQKYDYKRFKKLSMGQTIMKGNVEKGKGYNVFVKDRVYVHGKKRYEERYIKINENSLSKRDALSLGGTVVNESASATFYINESGKPVSDKGLSISVDPWSSISGMFYTRDNKHIESTSYRINTQGEINQISARGWLAERRKMEKTFSIKNRPARNVKIIDGMSIWKGLKIDNDFFNPDINRLVRGGFDIGF